MAAVSFGIDLAGVETRPTGIAVIDSIEKRVVLSTLYSDTEILDFAQKTSNVRVIVIDAPLSLPRGRESLEIRSGIHFRDCDRELARRHLKFFPITLGPMRKLTARGIQLAGALRSKGYLVFEGYPGAAQDILQVPRKTRGVTALSNGLKEMGLVFDEAANHHELDAITCAYVGFLYLHNKSELIGSVEEGQILLPMTTGVSSR